MGLPSSIFLLQFESWKITVLSRQISTKWATSHSYVELPEAKPDEIVNYFSCSGCKGPGRGLRVT